MGAGVGLFCFVDLICFLSQSLEPLPLASRMPRYEVNIFIFHHCLWSPEITPMRGSLGVLYTSILALAHVS